MVWSDWHPSYEYEWDLTPTEELGNVVGVSTGGSGVSPVSVLDAAVASLRDSGADWRDHPSLATFAYTIQTLGGNVIIDVFATYGYEAITLRPSVLEHQMPPTGPPFFPDNASPIPADKVNDATLFDFFQFEAPSSTFLGWRDTTLHDVAMEVTTNDGGAIPGAGGGTGPFSFTPPANAPTLIKISDPLPRIGPQFGVIAGIPQFPGPRLFPDDVADLLVSFDTDTRSTDRPFAPYTVPISGSISEKLPSPDVVLPMASVSRKDLSLLVMPGYFAGTPIPLTGDFGLNDNGFVFSGQSTSQIAITDVDYSFFEVGGSNMRTFPAHFRSPRWRYWIEPNTPPALRLNQRNDGLGISGAPPRLAQKSGSTNLSSAPRIGTNNTYS